MTIIADSDSDGTGAFTLGNTGDLLLTDNGPTVNGTLDMSAGGDIVLDGNIDTNGGSITLNTTNGGVSQALSASTNANDLVITAAGDIDFQGANAFTNLNILQTSSGNINVINNSNLSIDVINAVGSTVAITNSGTIDQTGAIGGIVAASLDVTGNNGNVTLNDTRNDVDSLTANVLTAGGSDLFFSYTDLDDLEVQDVVVSNSSTSPPDNSFLDIVTGGDMTLNGNVTVSGPSAGGSGVTLVAQNGADIIYQSGTITTDTINFQNDANSTTTGAVGSALNPIQTAATLGSSTIDINHGSNGGSGPALSGGDLFLMNTVGNLSLASYMTPSASDLQIENTVGDVDLTGTTLIDSSGGTTDELSASSIRLISNGDLFLPSISMVRPLVESRLVSTVGDIYLEAQNLAINNEIQSVGDVKLVSNSGSLQIQNTVDSSAGNVELVADDFSINATITAQNQVVIRELNSTAGIEINDGTATAGFATITTTDLGFMTGTDLGILIGNDLAHSGTKVIQLVSDINSSDIGGTALTFDTANSGGGDNNVLINANIDFSADGENLLFTGPGTASILPTSTSGDLVIDTGSGGFTSSVSQLNISGANDNSVGVNTNNANISGNVSVSSGSLAGSHASFSGNDLSVTDSVFNVTALNDTAIVDFSGDIDINTNGTVSVVGGMANDASARIVGGNVDIISNNTILNGGDGDRAFAEIGSNAGGSTSINSAGSIQMQTGTGLDADTIIVGGAGVGAVTLAYANCQGCDTQLFSNPVGNGVSDSGIFGRTIIQNGEVTASASNTGSLDPIPELDSLFNNFTAEYIKPVGEDEEEELLVCR